MGRLNKSYKDSSRKLCDILESEPGIRVHCRPTGGYFVWVDFLDLPEIDDEANSPAAMFAKYCLDNGLKFMPGVKCDSVFECFEQSRQPKELCHNSARLCFADMNIDDTEDGARLLIRLYRK